MELTTGYIDSLAPNGAAISNGKSLVKKGSFIELRITADETLIFGACAGSGKNPYFCSMDFVDAANPIPRCSCPSRQIPCKHVLGLLYAYAEGKAFSPGEIPPDIIQKREGQAKRAENKEKKQQTAREAAKSDAKPTKVKITAAIKRIDTQLDGIATADKLLKNIIQAGLAGIDARTQAALQQQVTALGNYHIKGIQAAFADLFLQLKVKAQDTDYTQAIDRLVYLSALLKRAQEHLQAKKQDPDHVTKPDTASSIEEQIGHVWKLDELFACDSYLQAVDLVQLSFNIIDDPAKKEFAETGLFVCLQNGRIYTAKNLRPYKAAKYINSADTLFEQLTTEYCYIYPGGLNPRIRYDQYITKPIAPETYAAIQAHAATDYAETAKAVKNQIKTPLAHKNPAALLHVTAVTQSDPYIILNDAKQNKQLLQGGAADTLRLLDFAQLAGTAMLVEYENNRDTGLLTARPLSIVTSDRIIRLAY